MIAQCHGEPQQGTRGEPPEQQIAGIHGGGSPVMEEIAILGSYDIEAKKALVKYPAGIKD